MEFRNITVLQKTQNTARPLDSASVYVESGGIAVSVFDENGASLSQPLTTNSEGQIGFAAANGAYDVRAVKGSFTTTLENVRFYDPEDERSVFTSRAALEAASVPANVYKVSYPVTLSTETGNDMRHVVEFVRDTGSLTAATGALVTADGQVWVPAGDPTPLHFGQDSMGAASWSSGVPTPYLLSDVFANLAAAQAVYPEASALTESVDSQAIQKAFDYLRDTAVPGRAKMVFPAGEYVITRSVDMTSFDVEAHYWFVEARGAVFHGLCSGKTVFDLLDSRRCWWSGGIVIGDATDRPSRGFQLGRKDIAVSAEGHRFEAVSTYGEFTETAMYCNSPELISLSDCNFWNDYDNANALCLILDGDNSDYTPASDYATVGPTGESPFNVGKISNCTFRKRFDGSAVYLSNGKNLEMSAYLVSWNAYGIILAGAQEFLNLYIHAEASDPPSGSGLVSSVRVKTGTTSCALKNCVITETVNHGSTSVISTDASGGAIVTLRGCVVSVDSKVAAGSANVFDTPASYRMTGRIELLSNTMVGNVNLNQFSGEIQCPNLSLVTVPAAGSFTIRDADELRRYGDDEQDLSLLQIGYHKGESVGGSVTQTTDKTTGVTLNAPTGRVITASASLASGASAIFTLTNSYIAATDIVLVNVRTPVDLYRAHVVAVAAGSCNIELENTSGGPLSQAVTINFAVISGSIN